MSSRLVKNGIPRIEIPNDEPIIELKVMKSGQVYLQAPRVHPRDVCKLLNGVIVDLMFASFQKEEDTLSTPPTIG